MFLQTDDRITEPALEQELLDVAERDLAADAPGGGRTLSVWANEHAAARQALFARQGYRKADWPEYQRRRSLADPILRRRPSRPDTRCGRWATRTSTCAQLDLVARVPPR